MSERQQVSIKQSEDYANSIGACGSYEVSAKDGTGINELFKEIAVKMQDQLQREQNMDALLQNGASNRDDFKPKNSIRLSQAEINQTKQQNFDVVPVEIGQ